MTCRCMVIMMKTMIKNNLIFYWMDNQANINIAALPLAETTWMATWNR
jgi:hypothetical protein